MTFAYALRGNKIYPVDHFEPGEMSIIAGNAPYLHSHDFAIVLSIFVEARLVSFMGKSVKQIAEALNSRTVEGGHYSTLFTGKTKCGPSDDNRLSVPVPPRHFT